MQKTALVRRKHHQMRQYKQNMKIKEKTAKISSFCFTRLSARYYVAFSRLNANNLQQFSVNNVAKEKSKNREKPQPNNSKLTFPNNLQGDNAGEKWDYYRSFWNTIIHTFMFGFLFFRKRPTPEIVPPVPIPATNKSTLPLVSSQISGPVVS